MPRTPLRLLLAGALLATPAAAADVAQSRQVVDLVYDVGLYNSEVDRVMKEAEGRGVFGGRGSTPATRAKDRELTRASMLGQREAVLRATIDAVAARASDLELRELMRVAEGGTPVNQPMVDSAVATVKSSFNDALWQQLSQVARGNAEFPCLKGNRSACR